MITDPVTGDILGLNSGQFTFSKAGKYTDDQFTANYDRDFRGGQDHISGRFFFSNFESELPFGAGGLTATLGGTLNVGDMNFPLDLPVHDRFLSVAETHIFSPRLVNEARVGYVRIDNNAINEPIVTVDDLGINRPNSNLYKTIYKFTFSTFNLGPTPGADQSQLQNNLTFLDTASYTTGKHLLRFGGQYDRVALDKNFPQTFNGELFFFPFGANPLDPTSPCVHGCTDFQNFLLGQPGFSFGGSGVSNHEYRINDYGVFFQDDYKATPNLTINAGLRWELFGAAKDNLCHIGNTVSALVNQQTSAFIYPKCVDKLGVTGLTGTASDTTMNNNYASNWGPRVGFAYDLFGHHTTSVRGGYGIFYVREDVGTVDQLSFSAPILPITTPIGTPGDMADIFASGVGRLPVGGQIDPTYVPVYSHFLGFVDGNGNPTTDTTAQAVFDNGFPNPFGDAAHPNGIFGGNLINLFGLEVPRHFVSPSTQQWNLSIQRELPRNWILEVGYVGTKGTHLRETRDAIQPYDARTHPVTVTALDGTQYTITQNAYSNANARSRALRSGNGQLPIVRQRRLVALRFFADNGGTPIFSVAPLPGGLHLVEGAGRHFQRQHGVQHGNQRSDQPAGFLRPVGFRSHSPPGDQLRLEFAVPVEERGYRGRAAVAMDAQRYHHVSIGNTLHGDRCRRRLGLCPEQSEHQYGNSESKFHNNFRPNPWRYSQPDQSIFRSCCDQRCANHRS